MAGKSGIRVGERQPLDLRDLGRVERDGALIDLTETERPQVELPGIDLGREHDHELLLGWAPPPRPWYETTKRAFDLVVALVLILVAAPLMILIAALIRLDSAGPAIFWQRRLGRSLTEFRFPKFRTMYVDARERFPEMYDYSFDDGARLHRFKTAEDPRLTRVGRIIRRTSLDELPNLLAVVTGHMSLVGPRPEIPEMLRYYRPEEFCKFAVMPGVTGLAQVSGRNMLLWAETNALDVEYVHRRGWRNDISILIRSVGAVVGMVGAL